MPVHRTPVSVAVPLWVLAIVAALFFVRQASALLIPIALACLIAYALYPLVLWLERARIPRGIGAALVVVAVAVGAASAAWSLRDDFADSVNRLPAQIRELRRQLESAGESPMLDRLRQALTEMRKTADSAQVIGGGMPGNPGGAAGGTGQTGGQLPMVEQLLRQGPASLVSLAGQVVVITFLVYFLMIGAREWRQRLIDLSGDLLSSRRTGAEVVDDATAQIQRFLIVHVITGAIVGTATWIIVGLLGGPAPVFWGVTAGVLNTIPYFGPLIVSVGLALAGLFAGGISMSLYLSGAALAITAIEGWALTPLLMGRAAHMNTLAVFVSLLVWSWLWGIWGTLLAVPMTTALKSIADHVEPLQPISRLLGDGRG